uniref:Uncharacterized protein n=1 Tax=Phlebotomus papatasi TaxID=29031 RepID=A0A1B0DDK7_PHLPP
MGTVLSFSPRERRPVYSTHHHGSGLSSAGSADFALNNFSYEQLNNVRNRENNKPSQPVPNNATVVLVGQTHNHTNSTSSGVANNTSLLGTDSARILSEKNALEKNLKKHSLFINALSWKRLAAASHGKKKLDNNKNKAANLPTATFRTPLTDVIHPLVADKNKNIQQQPQQQVFFTPGAPKALLALDLVRANNTNPTQQPDKLAPKLPLSLPLSLQTAAVTQPQHSHGPRKTVIQVSPGIYIHASSSINQPPHHLGFRPTKTPTTEVAL